MMSKVALLIIYNDIQNFKKITLGVCPFFAIFSPLEFRNGAKFFRKSLSNLPKKTNETESFCLYSSRMERLHPPSAKRPFPCRQHFYPFRGLHELARQQGTVFIPVSRIGLRIHPQLDFFSLHGYDMQAFRPESGDENFHSGPVC